MTYLGCAMDKTMSGEPMALMFINKINGKLKFLYQKNNFLIYNLIQPYFNYAYSTWNPNLNVKL